jgi:hypothetical protein
MEAKTGRKLKAFQSDGGGEYVAKEVMDWLSEKGVKQEFTNTYTPQEDSVSERKNRTLNDKAHSSIHETTYHFINHQNEPLPKNLWDMLSDTPVGWRIELQPVLSLPTPLCMRPTSAANPTFQWSEYSDARHGDISPTHPERPNLMLACTSVSISALPRIKVHTSFMITAWGRPMRAAM